MSANSIKRLSFVTHHDFSCGLETHKLIVARGVGIGRFITTSSSRFCLHTYAHILS